MVMTVYLAFFLWALSFYLARGEETARTGWGKLWQTPRGNQQGGLAEQNNSPTTKSNETVVDEEDVNNIKPSRGYHLPEKFEPDDLYQIYTNLRDDYRRVSNDDDGWKLLADRDGVQVSIMNHPEDPSCPYVRMKGVFPTPVENCWDFLKVDNWDYSMPKMDPFYEGVDCFQELDHKGFHLILCRKRTKRILAFAKRDLVFLSVADQPLDDGSWVSGTVSVHTKEIPRYEGYTRAFQDSVAFYKLLENNTKTEVTITCRIDLNDSGEGGNGGFIPMWLYVRTIGTTGVSSIVNMREALIAHQAEIQENSSEG